MVVHVVMLAERLHEGVDLAQVVTRDLREQVVIHLVLKPSTEEVYKRSARHIASGSDLKP